MINKEQFGKRIALLRKKFGISQAELAEKFNISSQAVSKWECGQALPDLDLLMELSWLYEISINSLLEENGNLFNDKISKEVMLPDDIDSLIYDKTQKKLISSISSYFNQSELYELAIELANGNLDLSLTIEATNKKSEYQKSAKILLEILSVDSLKELSDCVTSRAGFESMQHKTMQGFSEVYRILKQCGNAIYDMSIIDNHNSANTQKWIELLLKEIGIEDFALFDKMIEISEWEQKCISKGYKKTESIKIYDELPAPNTDVFPYENMIMRWMGQYICISNK